MLKLVSTCVGTWSLAGRMPLCLCLLAAGSSSQALSPEWDLQWRDELSVFGIEDWERHRGQLVCESWMAAAQKAMDNNKQVLWNVNSLIDIGGHRPMVLGSPQVIEAPGAAALLFDGQDDGIILDVNPLAGARSFTVEVIFRPDRLGQPAQRFLHMQASEDSRVLIETRLNDKDEWFLDTFIKSGPSERTLQSRDKLHLLGRWYHVALTCDGHVMRHYVQGVEEALGEVEYEPVLGGQSSIGCRLNRVFWFKGAIQKVRITPRVLAPGEFLRLAD